MVSNKTLGLLVVVALILSLGGTFLSLNILSKPEITDHPVSGYVAYQGRVNLTINASVSCTVPYNVSFGAGIKPGASNILSSDKANTDGFSDCTTGFTCSGILINNTGNVDVNVSFLSDFDGSDFLGQGAADSDYQFAIYNGTGLDHTLPGCIFNSTINISHSGRGFWTNVPITDTYICTNLTYNATHRHMALEFNTTIYSTSQPGTKTSALTVTCQQI